MADIYDSIRECRRCPNVKHGVITTRGEDGRVLFIGIQPSWKGASENVYRRSRGLGIWDNFWKLVSECGLGQFRFTNFVKCATDEASELPDVLEITNCLPWLNEEVKTFGTKFIVVVGKGWYYFWEPYIKEKLGLESAYILHYSVRVSTQAYYLRNQTKLLLAVRDRVTQLGIL